jgi:hypothetical protein
MWRLKHWRNGPLAHMGRHQRRDPRPRSVRDVSQRRARSARLQSGDDAAEDGARGMPDHPQLPGRESGGSRPGHRELEGDADHAPGTCRRGAVVCRPSHRRARHRAADVRRRRAPAQTPAPGAVRLPGRSRGLRPAHEQPPSQDRHCGNSWREHGLPAGRSCSPRRSARSWSRALCALILTYLVLSPWGLAAPSAADDESRISPDRPTVSNNADTVPPLAVQLEAGFVYQQEQMAGRRTEHRFSFEGTLRVGLLEGLEVRLFGEPFVTARAAWRARTIPPGRATSASA